MELDFHYYLTYVVALEAGFDKKEAVKIAYASQYVDDNCEIYIISDKNGLLYNSCPTQIYNPLYSIELMESVYTAYHFIPGESAKLSCRVDGKYSAWATTPGCRLASTMLKYALTTYNPYLIGIATHAYTDTWAHQNFSGIREDLNNLNNIASMVGPNIGHKGALCKPDITGCIWHDTRLVNSLIKNDPRFLDALVSLFTVYISNILCHKVKLHELDRFTNIAEFMIRNSSIIAGKYNNKKLFCDKYDVEPYSKNKWFYAAVVYDAKSKFNYKWRALPETTEWYMFQEAAKQFKGLITRLVQKRLIV